VKITSDKVENAQAFLTIEMEPAELEESLNKSYSRLVKKTAIPGFRKGKAPRVVLERHVGRDNLLEDALNELVPEACEKALAEKKIEAFARPAVEIVQKEPVIMKAVVPLKPTVILGDYHGIRLTPKTVELNDEQIDEAIESLRHQHANWEPVERTVALSDLLTLDLESKVAGNSYINQKDAQYQVTAGLPVPAPGFAEQLVGMGREEEKEFSLKFPDDYAQSELAGKEASFKVKVTEIKEERLLELNDDFARGVSAEFKSLAELRERLTSDMRGQLEDQAKRDFEDSVLDAVVEKAQIEFPPILVEAEIDQFIRDELRKWSASGRGPEEYLASINRTEKQLREELTPLATKKVTRSLVLGKVVEDEKISVADTDVNTEIDNIIEKAEDSNKDEVKKYLSTPSARESIKSLLLTRKTVTRLKEIAEGTASNITVEEKEVQK
jgi:trigger factor